MKQKRALILLRNTFFLSLISFFSFGQTNETQLLNELIREIENNKLQTEFPIDSLISEVNSTPDSLLSEFLNRKIKAFLTEIRYGHQPRYLEYNILKENLDTPAIEKVLAEIRAGIPMSSFIADFEPKSIDYQRYKNYFLQDTSTALAENVNFYRWLNRFSLPKYAVVNLPAAELRFYENGTQILQMNIVAGKPKTPTPRMATAIDAVVVYPYWTPPTSIATKELLPEIQKNIKYLERNNFQVLDKKGSVINPDSVNWKALSTKNFPYTLRQGTGCDNSLGLLKFNLKNPYSVYMHDTPHDEAHSSLFEKEKRFYSHGCMRLSKPVELANLIFDKPIIDEKFMKICLKDQKPKVINLTKQIPVFVVYHTFELAEDNTLINFEDIYKLLK